MQNFALTLSLFECRFCICSCDTSDVHRQLDERHRTTIPTVAVMHSTMQKPVSMRTLESQTHFMARTALIGSSSIKTCQQRSEIYINKSDLRASESLTQLKLTAEKMIQEQASVKTDLQITFSKLEKSEQEVRSLETRLQDTKNENAILRVKQQEALKLWEGLEAKFSSTRTFCNQLMETLQQLSVQVQEAEQGKQVLEDKLTERIRCFQEIRMQLDDLSLKKQNAESIAANWETEYRDLEKMYEQSKIALAQETAALRKLEVEKAELERHLQSSNELLKEEMRRLESAERQLEQNRDELEKKDGELEKINQAHADLITTKNKVYLQVEALKIELDSERSRNDELKQDLETMALKAKDLEDSNVVVVKNLLTEMASCKEWAQTERQSKEELLKDLKDLELRHQELNDLKVSLEKHVDDLQERGRVLNVNHEKSESRSSEMIKKLKNELEVMCQKLDEQAKDKLNIECHYQDLQTKVAALLATTEDLTNRKEQLMAQNSDLKMELGLATENANHTIQEKRDEIDRLSSKILQGTETITLQKNEISQLQQTVSEKDQLIETLMEQQKCLKSQYAKVLDQKVSAERLGDHTRRQAEIQLETKLMELNNHIREISERNDKEMKEMRKNYENEAKEAIMKEEQKAAAMLATSKADFELKMAELQQLSIVARENLQNEHQAQVKENLLTYEAEKKLLVSQYEAELKRSQESMKEEKRKWTEDFEMRIKELERKHTDKVKKLSTDNSSHSSKADNRVLRLEKELNVLQEELKEEKLRRQEDAFTAARKFEEAIGKFEADRRVYEDNCKLSNVKTQALQKELQEAKERLSVWDAKRRSLEREDSKLKAVKNKSLQEHSYPPANQEYSTGVKNVHALSHLNEGRKVESPVEKGKCDSATVPTHSKTVTHHEYEIATSDGRKTITRKRTKSTVMFEGQSPLEVKRLGRRKSTRLSSQPRKVKPSRVYATTMGDLFGGKSLDPYADDPYAFT